MYIPWRFIQWIRINHKLRVWNDLLPVASSLLLQKFFITSSYFLLFSSSSYLCINFLPFTNSAIPQYCDSMSLWCGFNGLALSVDDRSFALVTIDWSHCGIGQMMAQANLRWRQTVLWCTALLVACQQAITMLICATQHSSKRHQSTAAWLVDGDAKEWSINSAAQSTTSTNPLIVRNNII